MFSFSILKGGIMNVQNNVNFTGLYIHTRKSVPITKASINKLSQILRERGRFIKRLEKEENTDVFINETFDKVSLWHNEYGDGMYKYMKKSMPISELENEEEIVKTLQEAARKANIDNEHWNYEAQGIFFRKK